MALGFCCGGVGVCGVWLTLLFVLFFFNLVFCFVFCFENFGEEEGLGIL